MKCHGLDLAIWLASDFYSPKQSTKIFRQILEGLKYLHANELVHCDLKPSDIVIENGKIQLIVTERSFTYQYATLEILFGLDSIHYSFDVFYMSLCGKPLFTAGEPFGLIIQIIKKLGALATKDYKWIIWTLLTWGRRLIILQPSWSQKRYQ